MLAPDHRATLLDSLRPPPGFQLDVAVGTTYTLNLTTLLVVPTAYAMFHSGGIAEDEDASEAEPADQETGRLTPVGLLDALRRVSGRLTVFCDAAQIAPPTRTRRTLLGLVEDAVVPVVAPAGGVFHPKLWILRFRDAEGLFAHRLLVGTRNLTFDNCWDTITLLDSDPGGAPVAGVGDAIRSLSRIAQHPLSIERRDALAALAADMDGVRFAAPEGFSDIRLHTFGIGSQPWPFPAHCDRLLVVSPFLSGNMIKRLPQARHRRALISRPEALAAAPADDGYECYMLAPSLTDELPADEVNASEGDPSRSLAGLHAKLYVAGTADRTVWWTGSANATDAAFSHNVETLLEMTTTLGRLGVGELLRERRDSDPAGKTFRDLLLPWERVDGEIVEEPADDELDRLRRQVAATGFTATVTEQAPDRFDVAYTSDRPLSLPLAVEIRCWPATGTRPSSPTAPGPDETVAVSFPAVLNTLTAFLVVELRRGGTRTAFSVRCLLVGAPERRHQRLVAELLGDPDRLLRYLLALLADDDTLLLAESQVATGAAGWRLDGVERLPLVELMMRALARDPARLREVSDILATIREAGQPLPPSLMELWDAVWQVATEQAGARDDR